MKKVMLNVLIAIFILSCAYMLPSSVSANHSWGDYHWARTSNPFTLKLGSSVSSAWAPYLTTTSNDWSQSTLLDMPIVPSGTNSRNCRPTAGRVEVCNSKYGKNGWLGIAQIWTNGSHIVQAVTKMNDTYFSTRTYNTSVWRNFVMCQEVGHAFGLDHQDEVFDNANLGSCMDYTNDPEANQHPNQHDYQEIELIYSHLDDFTTLSQDVSMRGSSLQETFDNPSDWGKLIKKGDKTAVYESVIGVGRKVITFVIYAE